MKFISISELAPGRTRDELAALKQQGVRAVWALMTQGIIRAAYQRREAVGVVLELEVEDGATAMNYLRELPAIKAGVLQVASLIACDPFVALESCFAGSQQQC